MQAKIYVKQVNDERCSVRWKQLQSWCQQALRQTPFFSCLFFLAPNLTFLRVMMSLVNELRIFSRKVNGCVEGYVRNYFDEGINLGKVVRKVEKMVKESGSMTDRPVSDW